jgi:hypothetical protein
MLFTFLFILASGCTDEQERYENIRKLRAFGTATDPVSSSPSTGTAPKTVTLTFYAAMPKGTSVAAETFIDDKLGVALPLPISVVAGSEAIEEHATLDVWSIKATAVIPTEDKVRFIDGQNFARFRYGMRLTAGSEEEKIVGNVLVYREGSGELQWTFPTINVQNPAEGANLNGKQDISMTIDSQNGENFRISWFVNDGKIKNRRGKSTEFEPTGSGDHTMIATARGLKSGAFQYKVIDFKVE